MKKEQELAERRKNDPALNQTQDHLVRKLFSKFRKGGQENPYIMAPTLTGGPEDLERGERFLTTDNGMVPGEILRWGIGGRGQGKNFKNRIAAAESCAERCNIAGTDLSTKSTKGWAKFKGVSDERINGKRMGGAYNERNSK